MSTWEVTNLRGWTSSQKRLPPEGKDVLVWRPWRRDETEVKHIKESVATKSGTGEQVVCRHWYPGGSDVQGTYWKALPKTPDSRLT